MKCPPTTTTSTLASDIVESVDVFNDIEDAPSRVGFRCRCCGKISIYSPTHAVSKVLRLEASAVPIVIGRRGLSIAEIMRRCRVCIVMHKSNRGSWGAIITGCSLEAVAHTCDIIHAHIARVLAEQHQAWNPLMALVRRAPKRPEQVLASRPAGRWRLEGDAIVSLDNRTKQETRGQWVSQRNTTAVSAAAAKHVRIFAPSTDTTEVDRPPTEHQRRPSASLTWRAVARRRPEGSLGH